MQNFTKSSHRRAVVNAETNKTRETPKIRNRELYSYYHHFIRILVWYRNK